MTAVVPMLEDSSVWLTDGHLAGAAIAALADGESALLPQRAVQHAVMCAACCEQVGLAALFALEVADVARTVALAPERQIAARSVPAATHETTGAARVPALPPLAPRPLSFGSRPRGRASTFGSRARGRASTVPALLVVLALVAGAPLLETLRESSPAHLLARLARIIAQAALAARAPGIAELSWLAAAILVVVGLLIARSAAHARPHVSAGLP
jgi:hypothetical protein